LKKKPIKILKKPTGSVRFYKPKTKKTETEQKKTEPNWKKNQAKPVSVRFWFFLKKKIRFGYFFYKNRTE